MCGCRPGRSSAGLHQAAGVNESPKKHVYGKGLLGNGSSRRTVPPLGSAVLLMPTRRRSDWKGVSTARWDARGRCRPRPFRCRSGAPVPHGVLRHRAAGLLVSAVRTGFEPPRPWTANGVHERAGRHALRESQGALRRARSRPSPPGAASAAEAGVVDALVNPIAKPLADGLQQVTSPVSTPAEPQVLRGCRAPLAGLIALSSPTCRAWRSNSKKSADRLKSVILNPAFACNGDVSSAAS